MKHRMAWMVILVLLATPMRAPAQEMTAADTKALIQQLLARIDKLENRVVQLEGGGNIVRASAVSIPPVAQEAVAPQSGHEGMPGMERQGINIPEAMPTYPSLKIAGFSDFNFSAVDQHGVKSGFNEGQFVVHLSSALSPKVIVFGEVTATARADAGTGVPAATGFNVEVERAFIRYDQSDYFKVSFGRYHTPITYWNSTFHHGTWLQTTIARPEELANTRFIPIHFVGAQVEGAIPAGGLHLNYDIGVGNGRGNITTRAGDAGDNNNNRAWLVNLFAKPSGLFGLLAGGSVYRDKITLPTGREFQEWITSGYIVWQKEDPELIAEFSNANHQAVNGSGNFNSQSFYVQIGYRLPWFEKLWKPYYRFDYVHVPSSDLVFQGTPNLAGSSVGLRYEISSFAAIKAEYRNQRRLPGVPHVNGAFLQTSFTF